MTDHALTLVALAAERRYLADHPVPTAATDFACARCGAETGKPCSWGRRPVRGRPYHVDRLDLWIKAARQQYARAADAGRTAARAAEQAATAPAAAPVPEPATARPRPARARRGWIPARPGVAR